MGEYAEQLIEGQIDGSFDETGMYLGEPDELFYYNELGELSEGADIGLRN